MHGGWLAVYWIDICFLALGLVLSARKAAFGKGQWRNVVFFGCGLCAFSLIILGGWAEFTGIPLMFLTGGSVALELWRKQTKKSWLLLLEAAVGFAIGASAGLWLLVDVVWAWPWVIPWTVIALSAAASLTVLVAAIWDSHHYKDREGAR